MVATRSGTQRISKDGLHQSDQEDDGNTPQPPVTMTLLHERIAQIQKEMRVSRKGGCRTTPHI
jgi:hypothetical protein